MVLILRRLYISSPVSFMCCSWSDCHVGLELRTLVLRKYLELWKKLKSVDEVKSYRRFRSDYFIQQLEDKFKSEIEALYDPTFFTRQNLSASAYQTGYH